MKKKVIELIKILGVGCLELVMDIKVGQTTFNSIEYSEDEDKVYLHIFIGEDEDYFCDFDEMEIVEQKTILVALSILYN